jgi:hypothetical protein
MNTLTTDSQMRDILDNDIATILAICRGEREYRIKYTGFGMERHGCCEICGKRCDLSYVQQWRKVNSASKGWSCRSYGHAECLQFLDYASAPIVHDCY